jgi:hypothetical protein
VIDDLLRVNALLAAMDAALPLHVALTPQLAAAMRKERPGRDLPREWRVTEVSYAGDPGGIMCRLDDGTGGDNPFIVSITHLIFDRRVPMAREIATYQKRRVKWIRRMGAAKRPLRTVPGSDLVG